MTNDTGHKTEAAPAEPCFDAIEIYAGDHMYAALYGLGCSCVLRIAVSFSFVQGKLLSTENNIYDPAIFFNGESKSAEEKYPAGAFHEKTLR
jgi:hypothetical protein